MSRIGKKPISIPAGVEVKIDGQSISVKGPKGSLTQTLTGTVSVEFDANAKEVRLGRGNEADRAKHGLYRALINNMVEGVTKGYTKTLEIQGVGYRALLQGKKLNLFVGYNTKIPEVYTIPDGLTVTLPTQTEIVIVGIDKHLVGQAAASIRLIRPPDVYKGKGVRYKGEVPRKLPGKTVAASK